MPENAHLRVVRPGDEPAERRRQVARSIADMTELLESWRLHLRAARKSPSTIRTYSAGVRMFLQWCGEVSTEASFDKTTVITFIAGMVDAGAEGSTAASRQNALKMFAQWLAEEGEIDTYELARLEKPKIDVQPLKPLSEDELKALFAACRGPRFVDLRDEAMVRLKAEAFPRAGDMLSMTVSGTHVSLGTAAIIGKGAKPRIIPFGAATGVALDRYLRARRRHKRADTDVFWLGDKGTGFTYPALYYALCRRAESAGIPDFHPHRLRATGATRWLDKGGSEIGLMAIAGWSSLEMVKRYTAHTRQTRAVEEAQGLNLGDL